MFISNALIGLREGLEAGIVITAIAAFLTGWDRRHELRWVWIGVAAALLTSVAVGAVLALTAANLGGRAGDVFDAVAGAVAVAFVTTMIFWMRRSAREERKRLRGKLTRALHGGPLAIFAVAFLAIVREGVEASVFVLVLTDGGGASAGRSVAGLFSGIAVATAIICLLYAGMVRINMSKFLTVTGLALLVIGAGIVAHLVTTLQRLSLLPGAGAIAFDTRTLLPVDSWYGAFLDGVSGISDRPTVLALLAWASYIIAVLSVLRLALRLPAAHEPAVAAVGFRAAPAKAKSSESSTSLPAASAETRSG